MNVEWLLIILLSLFLAGNGNNRFKKTKKESSKPNVQPVELNAEELPSLSEILDSLELSKYLSRMGSLGISDTRHLLRLLPMDYRMMIIDWDMKEYEVDKLKLKVDDLIKLASFTKNVGSVYNSSSLMYSLLMSSSASKSDFSKKGIKEYLLYIKNNNIVFPLINGYNMVKNFVNCELLAQDDVNMKNTLSRQVLSKNAPNNVVGITKSRCKYNYPQAFINSIITDTHISTGFIRLSCPHLVREIDSIENSLITKINDILKDNTELQQNYQEINEFYRDIKHELLSTDVINDLLLTYLGGSIDNYNNFMNSGILGVSNINDVKCLHAHTADYLLRGNNKIGEMTLAILKNNGVDVNGCDNCHQQCNFQHKIDDSSWFYIPAKNKLGLRLSKLHKHDGL